MGYRTRHFCALMKKNWIIWKRTLGASLCELFCPVVLMLIMVLARALITQNVYSPNSHMGNSVLMAPMAALSAIQSATSNSTNSTLNSTSTTNASSSPNVNLTTLFAYYNQQYGGLSNFS